MLRLTGQALRALSPPQCARMSHSQKVTSSKPGSCGIPPFQDPVKKAKMGLNAPERFRFKLPDHLIRPPCLPGSEPGKEQACLLEAEGVFCPANRLKYKYPPFSENMDMIRGDGKVCWWSWPRQCEMPNKDESISRDRPDIQILK